MTIIAMLEPHKRELYISSPQSEAEILKGLVALSCQYPSLQGDDKPTTARPVRNAVKTYGRSVVHRYPLKGKDQPNHILDHKSQLFTCLFLTSR